MYTHGGLSIISQVHLVMVSSCRQSPQNKRKRKAKAVIAARVTGAVADKKRKRVTANIIAATAKAAVAATNTSMKLEVDNVMKKFCGVYNDYKHTQWLLYNHNNNI